MITKLEIENYRGIKTGTVDNLAHINVFVGRNGSGKSTILEPIFLTSHIIKPIPEPSIYHQSHPECTKTGFISSKRNLPIAHQAATIINNDKQYTKYSFHDNNWWFAGDKSNNMKFHIRMGGSVFSTFIDNNGLSEFRDHQLSPDDEEFLSNILYLDASLAYRKRVEEVSWEHILTKAQKKSIIDKYNSVYSQKISDIDYSPKGFFVTPKDAPFGIFLDNLGAGMRIGIRLLMLLGIFRNTAILLEEFDAYEHPDSLRSLIEIIFQASKDNGIQFFLTTHRTDSIRTFLEFQERFPETEGRIFGTALPTSGELKTNTLSFKDAEKMFEGGFDFRDMEDYV